MCKPLKSLGIFLLHSKSVVASEGEEDSSFPRGGVELHSLSFLIYIYIICAMRARAKAERAAKT